MKCDVLIAGGGPAGLRCARKLAEQGIRVILIERQAAIGKKVCAGGITWSGLIKRLPGDLIERSFQKQRISTRFQSVILSSEHPMVATVNREKLGSYMAGQAREKGVEILTGIKIRDIAQQGVKVTSQGKDFTIRYDFLVGADGSNSRIRSYLGLQTAAAGIGLNYTFPGKFPEMMWNFDSKRFGSGYSWIFPHRECFSAGAFASGPAVRVQRLKAGLDGWLQKTGLSLENMRVQAEKVNSDYRGYRFNRVFLLGDAAGLASPLTGEGIFPAILSAETVANLIVDEHFEPRQLEILIKKHQAHKTMQRLAATSPIAALILSELSAFLLKHDKLSFTQFEMA